MLNILQMSTRRYLLVDSNESQGRVNLINYKLPPAINDKIKDSMGMIPSAGRSYALTHLLTYEAVQIAYAYALAALRGKLTEPELTHVDSTNLFVAEGIDWVYRANSVGQTRNVRHDANGCLCPIDNGASINEACPIHGSVKLGCGGKGKPRIVIDRDRVTEYVGSGWIELRKATKTDRKRYPKLVD